MWICLSCALKEVCKSNNVTDHQQAMVDTVAAAVLQQSNKDVTEEADTTADSSDEQRLTDDEMPSLEDTELPKEDLWWDAEADCCTRDKQCISVTAHLPCLLCHLREGFPLTWTERAPANLQLIERWPMSLLSWLPDETDFRSKSQQSRSRYRVTKCTITYLWQKYHMNCTFGRSVKNMEHCR